MFLIAALNAQDGFCGPTFEEGHHIDSVAGSEAAAALLAFTERVLASEPFRRPAFETWFPEIEFTEAYVRTEWQKVLQKNEESVIDGEHSWIIPPERQFTANLERFAHQIGHPSAMNDALADRFIVMDVSCDARIYVTEDRSSAPQADLRLTSASLGPFLLPWTVSAGGRTFVSWDHEISLALGRFLPETSELRARLSPRRALRLSLDLFFWHHLNR